MICKLVFLLGAVLAHGLGDEAWDNRCITCLYRSQYYCSNTGDFLGYCAFIPEFCQNTYKKHFGFLDCDQPDGAVEPLTLEITGLMLEEKTVNNLTISMRNESYQLINIKSSVGSAYQGIKIRDLDFKLRNTTEPPEKY